MNGTKVLRIPPQLLRHLHTNHPAPENSCDRSGVSEAIYTPYCNIRHWELLDQSIGARFPTALLGMGNGDGWVTGRTIDDVQATITELAPWPGDQLGVESSIHLHPTNCNDQAEPWIEYGL